MRSNKLTREQIRLGMGPLGYMPSDRVTDGGMSLAPRGFKEAVIRARAQNSNDELTRQMDAGETKEPEK